MRKGGKFMMQELAKVNLSNTRRLVLSKNFKSDSIVLGQQLLITEGENKTTTIFLKNAIYLETPEVVKELRDALNVVLKELNKK